jgi:hypothetical protein
MGALSLCQQAGNNIGLVALRSCSSHRCGGACAVPPTYHPRDIHSDDKARRNASNHAGLIASLSVPGLTQKKTCSYASFFPIFAYSTSLIELHTQVSPLLGSGRASGCDSPSRPLLTQRSDTEAVRISRAELTWRSTASEYVLQSKSLWAVTLLDQLQRNLGLS